MTDIHARHAELATAYRQSAEALAAAQDEAAIAAARAQLVGAGQALAGFRHAQDPALAADVDALTRNSADIKAAEASLAQQGFDPGAFLRAAQDNANPNRERFREVAEQGAVLQRRLEGWRAPAGFHGLSPVHATVTDGEAAEVAAVLKGPGGAALAEAFSTAAPHAANLREIATGARDYDAADHQSSMNDLFGVLGDDYRYCSPELRAALKSYRGTLSMRDGMQRLRADLLPPLEQIRDQNIAALEAAGLTRCATAARAGRITKDAVDADLRTLDTSGAWTAPTGYGQPNLLHPAWNQVAMAPEDVRTVQGLAAKGMPEALAIAWGIENGKGVAPHMVQALNSEVAKHPEKWGTSRIDADAMDSLGALSPELRDTLTTAMHSRAQFDRDMDSNYSQLMGLIHSGMSIESLTPLFMALMNDRAEKQMRQAMAELALAEEWEKRAATLSGNDAKQLEKLRGKFKIASTTEANAHLQAATQKMKILSEALSNISMSFGTMGESMARKIGR
jgi:hypothetical protein